MLLDEPLSGYTTYRIGGLAAAVLRPLGVEDVAVALQFCVETGVPVLALGLGSNVLVADGGFSGLVIHLGKGMDRVVEGEAEEHVWRVGAGFPTPRLARRTAAAGLAGAQRLIGIPGTVGGGIAVNAGAHGQEYSQIVQRVEYLDMDGVLREMPGSDIQWGYRDSGFRDVVITSAAIKLCPADRAELEDDIRRRMEWRRQRTPFAEPCCGSVFKNPRPQLVGEGQEGVPRAQQEAAGQLIDAAGLKGFRIGAAEVSRKHANYIVNLGGATAADVLSVVDAVRQAVLREFGVELELEIRIIY